jgi:type II secretory pathway pseudopilin PulG
MRWCAVASLKLNERGFSLMEALTGATITVIAVVGLAYSFGVGRGLVNRYEVARAALGEAQSQLEALQLVSRNDPSMAFGYASPPTPFRYEGVTLGTSSWRVLGYDEPSIPGTQNLKRVVVTVTWTRNTQTDSVSLERLWQP